MRTMTTKDEAAALLALALDRIPNLSNLSDEVVKEFSDFLQAQPDAARTNRIIREVSELPSEMSARVALAKIKHKCRAAAIPQRDREKRSEDAGTDSGPILVGGAQAILMLFEVARVKKGVSKSVLPRHPDKVAAEVMGKLSYRHRETNQFLGEVAPDTKARWLRRLGFEAV